MNTSLIGKLRRRIRDDQAHHKAMSVSVTDASVSRAILEITDGRLLVTVSGGSSVPSIDLDLSSSRYSTIERLHSHLTRLNGYSVELDADASGEHLSSDLFSVPALDIGPGQSVAELKHYLFSDAELEEVLNEATQRHNPGLSLSTVPQTEEVFVLALAHAEVCRRQAYNSAKRRGMSESVGDLLQIADSLENSYANDTKRLARSLVSPVEAPSHTMNEGDVVVGTLHRTSLRTGIKSAVGQNLPPTIPEIVDLEDARDVEDTNILVRWKRNKDNDFLEYQLWMDTTEEVERYDAAPARGSASVDEFRAVSRVTTSKLVFQSTSGRVRGASGQDVATYNVGDLEPDTDYFFRLYVKDQNGALSASEVVRFKTKPLRARFAELSYVTPTRGDVGATVTLNLDSEYGEFTADHRVRFGGVEVAATIISSFQVTCAIPSFSNKRVAKDVVIVSPGGLYDVKQAAFTVN